MAVKGDVSGTQETSPSSPAPQRSIRQCEPLWHAAACSNWTGTLPTAETVDKHNICFGDSKIKPNASGPLPGNFVCCAGVDATAGDASPALFDSNGLPQHPFHLTGDCDFSQGELRLDSSLPPSTSSNFSPKTKDVAQRGAQRGRNDAPATASPTPAAKGNFSHRAERRREGSRLASISEQYCTVGHDRPASCDPVDGMSARLLAIAFLFLAYLNQDGGEVAVQPVEMRQYLHHVLGLPQENRTTEYQGSLRAVKFKKGDSPWLSTVLC